MKNSSATLSAGYGFTPGPGSGGMVTNTIQVRVDEREQQAEERGDVPRWDSTIHRATWAQTTGGQSKAARRGLPSRICGGQLPI